MHTANQNIPSQSQTQILVAVRALFALPGGRVVRDRPHRSVA
jgi:hypothetical protein